MQRKSIDVDESVGKKCQKAKRNKHDEGGQRVQFEPVQRPNPANRICDMDRHSEIMLQVRLQGARVQRPGVVD
jgi:hypothetical protein